MASSSQRVIKPLFAGHSDPGLLRPSNQDDYYLDAAGRFFVVADGMGGHAGGQEASRLATKTIAAHLESNWDGALSSRQILEDALLAANQAILKDQQQHPERADMGTTAVVVIFRDDVPWCAHIGDSRLYRLRGAKLDQITEDHTWVARALREGELTADQVRFHPWRHVLSQCLGRDDIHQVSTQPIDISVGDRLLLCSDGLTEELSDPLIAFHLKSIRACNKAVQTLVEAAKDKGGRDNITVIVLHISEQKSDNL